MIRMKRTLAVLAVVAFSLAVAGCNGKKDITDISEVDLPTSEELSISIDRTLLEFRHVVGQSPCPQLVGRITIRNTGRSPFTTDIRTRGPAPLTFSPDQTIPPGGTAVIEVFFTCSSQQSFLVTVDTLRENAAQQESSTLPPGSFNVSGIIQR
jgi:hypothetical protein